MSRIFYLILFLSIFVSGYAQDLNPGQQAQGCLDNKNVTVDHTTGIFHYTVPLYKISSGAYELPITLNYNAKGVKVDDPCGLIGYNWNLNIGGVVTRVLRGGIPDEHPLYGYAVTSKSNIPLKQDETKVNNRERDGECDIFTAVFNGESVSFIIHIDSLKKVEVTPLEATNVRIEAIYHGVYFEGWTVTDENGNKYIYNQKEMTLDAVQDNAISMNGFRETSFPSSWYLTKIEPQNGNPILFEYSGVNHIQYELPYESKYTYGMPVIEHTFDFSQYEREFSRCLSRAISLIDRNTYDISEYLSELQANQGIYSSYNSWILNPTIEAGKQEIAYNQKIIGILSDLRGVNNASEEMLNVLDKLKIYYNGVESASISYYLGLAQGCIINSLKEIQTFNDKTVINSTCYVIQSPLLKSICYSDRNILFDYNYAKTSLTQIKVCDLFKKCISEIRFSSDQYNLQEVSYLDKESKEVSSILFEYYDLPIHKSIKADLWGFTREVLEEEVVNPDIKYLPVTSPDFAKYKSLKCIRNKKGSSLTIDYELNKVANQNVITFGGIRLKSLIFNDSIENIKDFIDYDYPLSGYLVYNECYNNEILQYHDFFDRAHHTIMKYRGAAYVNTGNNGVYYPYVTEKRKGKGMKTYLFYVPSMRTNNFAFWLYGLPLGTAAYDENGALKQMTINRYDADLSETNLSSSSPIDYTSFFTTNGIAPKYMKRLEQLGAYEFYMNQSYLESYYRHQRDELSRSCPYTSRYVNPYNSVYIPNLSPRTMVLIPDMRYELKYGGKVLLKEQLEYRFETPVTSQSKYTDYYNAKLLSQPFGKAEFCYDNVSKSIYPTRTIYTSSTGDRYLTEEKRVTEFINNPNPMIQEMIDKNIHLPILKKRYMKNNIILKENINLYTKFSTDEASCIVPDKQYALINSGMLDDKNSFPNDSLFTYSKEKYRIEKCWEEYKFKKKTLLPEKEISVSDTSRILYDTYGRNIILKVSNLSSGPIEAYEQNKYLLSLNDNSSWRYRIIIHDLAIWLFDMYRKLGKMGLFTEEQLMYLSSEEAYKIHQLLSAISGTTKPFYIDELCLYLEELRSNSNKAIYDYHAMCRYIIAPLVDDPYDMEEKLCTLLDIGLTSTFILNRQCFEEMEIFQYRDLLLPPKNIIINNISDSSHLMLYILNETEYAYSDVVISHSLGESNLSFSSVKKFGIFDIDLSIYKDVSSIEISNFRNASYIVVVPSNTPFEATSYNIDDTVHAKFDAAGKLELYEYDAAGRLIRVKDQNGHIVKEYMYNNISNNKCNNAL